MKCSFDAASRRKAPFLITFLERVIHSMLKVVGVMLYSKGIRKDLSCWEQTFFHQSRFINFKNDIGWTRINEKFDILLGNTM